MLISADIINFVIDAGFKPLHFSTIDLNYNNGLGKVTVKKSPINTVDTLNGGRISAVRHANGRDWWVITSKWESNIFVKYLLGPDGIAPAGEQTVSGEPMHNGIANAVFSPDGQWHAIYTAYGTTTVGDCGFHLFRFDRCTGEFSQPIFHWVDGVPWPGSAVFSPDSRFLYIIRWDRILQYDLAAPDLLASETLVAEYDGFLDERGLATRFFMAQLAPDNRIYINIPNWNSRYLHVIDQPNAKGDSCNVIQHAIFLPTYNSFSFPNFPNFRLYAEAGSICDSIVVANPPEPPALARQIRVWPVPAAEVLHFSASGEWPGVFRLQLFDALGRPALDRDDLRLAPAASVPLDGLPPGMYFYVLSQQGRRVQAGKVVRAAE
ncbi:MAG: T9SS type A sorting domain-containing protein [Saprospiraceae bacterium]